MWWGWVRHGNQWWKACEAWTPEWCNYLLRQWAEQGAETAVLRAGVVPVPEEGGTRAM